MLPPTPFYHHITKGLFTAVLFTSISHLGIKKKLQDILFISLKRQSNYQNQTWQIYWNYQTWNSNNYQKKQGNSRKTSTLLTMPKPLTVWITINCGKFWKWSEYQTTWSASWETCMQVRKQQLELDMEQQTGSKLGKEYIKAVYCHPAYYMQSTSCEMPG